MFVRFTHKYGKYDAGDDANIDIDLARRLVSINIARDLTVEELDALIDDKIAKHIDSPPRDKAVKAPRKKSSRKRK